LSNRVWNSFIARQYFKRLRGYSKDVCSTIVEQVDARTFFETAALLLRDCGELQFRHPTYVLCPSKRDQTLDYDHIGRAAAFGGKHVRVIDLDVDHYPRDLSRAYFQRAIPVHIIRELYKIFFAQREANGPAAMAFPED
jgi:hypothetical protein